VGLRRHESAAVLDRYLEAGGNSLDTADVMQAAQARSCSADCSPNAASATASCWRRRTGSRLAADR
jgi:hypothetical protein